ncbi:COP9 signalosome [Zopfochytrium polystomum]|nr:COP9 signalosome [Zopfochytrium polystomum]
MEKVESLYDSLKKEFGSPKADLSKCGKHLSDLKLQLIKLSFLKSTNKKELLLTRDVLEIGALWSVRAKDIPSFERYVAQLKTYYNDYSGTLPPSQRMYTILGLNLLSLLAQNRISEFHTELELINPEQLASNIYIQHPIKVEQCLMEGSYNKVWNSRSNVPAEEYLFFIDILMGTIRNEIASCSEKAYTNLPIADAATLLYFKSPKEVLQFASEHGWTIQNDHIVFAKDDSDNIDIPSSKMIWQSLGYARELERIGCVR